jgi:hypothetical protein
VIEADAFERRGDATARLWLSRGGEDLEVLSPREVSVETGLVDNGSDPRQGQVAVFRHLVAE